MDTFTIVILIIVFILSYLTIYKRDRKYNLPLGPKPFPIIGTLYKRSLLHLANIPKLRTMYGEASLCYIGSTRVVHLNSIDLVKDAFVTNGKIFSDRGHENSMTNRIINPQLKGIIHSDYNNNQRENRNTSLTIFRNLGVGRSIMEDRI